jgi:hypothetical protein
MAPSPAAVIPATRVHTITARSIGHAFAVSVALPPSYPSSRDRFYPTIYLLDADFHFGMVTDIARGMVGDEDFPEALVVGIGYPAKGSLRASTNRAYLLRSRDLTPVADLAAQKMLSRWLKVKRVETGGGHALLKFIGEQLIPFVEARYRSNPTKRVLLGHSFGGLFALYALFTDYRLFKGYVVANPSLWYSDKIAFKYEADYAKHHKRLPVKLFLVAGELEEDPKFQMTSNLVSFAGRMKSRRYRGLTLASAVIPKCSHCASTAPAYQVGLHAILGKQEVLAA